MNILFLYSQPIIPQRGGVERVTNTLANFFEENDHSVYFLARDRYQSSDKRQFYLPDSSSYRSDNNVSYYLSFLKEKKIDVVINQGGLLSDISDFSYHTKDVNAKLIAVIHNSLLSVADNFVEVFSDSFKKRKIHWLLPLFKAKLIKKIIRTIYINKKRHHYTNLIDKCDIVSVLSSSYIEEINEITNIKSEKVIAIPNPILIPVQKKSEKRKELLYVGRVNVVQKKVDSLINIWNKLYNLFPDWKLIVVGEGPDLTQLQNITKQKGIQNVLFEGLKDPTEYYRGASIFCLTSSFEGLPMTILEAMSFGAVPVIFNSFSSAKDVIRTYENGILVRPFDENGYATELSYLMNDQKLLNRLSYGALISSRDYSISKIGQYWLDLLMSLK